MALVAAALAVGLGAPGQAAAAPGDPAPTATCPVHDPAGTPYAAGVNCRVVEVDGHPRQFIVYVPRRPRTSSPPAPLVFMFHGGSGTGEQFLRISGWREQADATGLVAVFPTALRSRALDANRPATHWNTFTLASEIDLSIRPPGYPVGAPWPADDIGFVDAMVADVRAGLAIDRRRIYSSGFSNGAAFTARLAVERAEVLAAAAFSGGGLHTTQAPVRPIPMYAAVGTLDDRVLAQTGPPPLTALPLDPVDLLAVPVVDSVIGAHLGTLGLDASDFGAVGDPHLTTLRWPAVGTGAGGALFRFATIDGLGHHYPRAGDSPSGFAAASEFWAFFQEHPLP